MIDEGRRLSSRQREITGRLGTSDLLSDMAPIIPDPRTIKNFHSQAAFATWLDKNYGRETEIWIKVYKKHSGESSITCPEALDVALCSGWIDGLRKSFDERAFLQRYSPIRLRSRTNALQRRRS